ncbi:MAG: hypothetical protein KGL39_53410 [Patescibacteria group bacterium]|nr:hypothetical protein [Patescibacteria group bacterium]
MKKFSIWHGPSAKQEIIEGNQAVVKRSEKGMQVKIGKRTVKNVIALIEVCEPVIFKP